MISSKNLQQLALLFENNNELPATNRDLCDLLDLLQTADRKQLDAIEGILLKLQKSTAHCTNLLTFVKQYRNVCSEAATYRDTLQAIESNVNALIDHPNTDITIKQVPINSYVKVLGPVDNSIFWLQIKLTCSKFRLNF